MNESLIFKSFEKTHYRILLMVLGVSIFFNVFLGGWFCWTVIYAPQAQYYATTINSRVTPLVPLDQPNMPPSTLLQWSGLAAVAINTYDFVGYPKEINALANYFTVSGWDQFVSAWQSSQNLNNLTKNKLVVSAVTAGAPVIIDQGVMSGVYTWKVQVPVLITYQSASETQHQNIVVRMTIERISTLRSARGIGIADFAATS